MLILLRYQAVNISISIFNRRLQSTRNFCWGEWIKSVFPACLSICIDWSTQELIKSSSYNHVTSSTWMKCGVIQFRFAIPPLLPSLATHTHTHAQQSLSYDINAITPTQHHLLHLPSYRCHDAWSVIHSTHDNHAHLFMCRFVSGWSSIITHCRNYTSFVILLWIMY